MNLKALLEKKTSLQKELRAMSDKITKEVRAWTPEEETKFNGLQSEVTALTSTVDAIQKARELENVEEVAEGDAPAPTADAVAQGEQRAFANYIRATISSKESRADANLAYADSSNAIIPKTIAKQIITRVYDLAPIVDKATKYVTKGSLEIPVYGPNTTSDITMAYSDEFAELESNIGKFTSVELQGFLSGALAKVSNSLINNTDVDLVNFVVERIAYTVARFMEHELLIGTAGKVKGMSDLAVSQIIDTKAVGVVSGDDLIALKNMVKQAFRQSALWVMSTATKTTIETLKDGNGRYLFTEDLTGEFDGKVLGYPCYVSDNMVDVTAGALAIYFGDFSGLALKTTEQLEIQVLREKYATQHATGIVAWTEFDAKIENHQKLAGLKVKTV